MRSAEVAMVVVSLVPAAWSLARAEDTDAIATLTPDQARGLVNRERWPLSFDSLAALSPAVAQALAINRSCLLSLDGLAELSDEAAEALANGLKGVSLERVDRLSVRSARALARRGGMLTLGIVEMSPGVAQELATHAGRMISFDRLQTLSPQAAKALTNHKGSLYLTAVRKLEDDAVAALLRHEGDIMLDGDVKASEKARWALQNSSTIDLNYGF